MKPKTETIYVVDISSFVFRAYYGIRPLHHSSGQTTHAVYGVITMLLRLLKEQKPEHLAIAFDSPTPSFRKDIYDQYKANREAAPEDLPAQFEKIKEFVSLYPLVQLQCDGYEADDIIATIVEHFKGKPDIDVVIVSADKDLMQLVGDNVIMYDSMKDREINEAAVIERFGVPPAQVCEVLALAGDASDNIPGVKGVGEKTAGKLIAKYKTIENVYEHLEEIGGKLAENLANSKDNAFLSKKLVALKNDVPITIKEHNYLIPQPDQAKLGAFYQEMEFKSLARSAGITDQDSETAVSKNTIETASNYKVAPPVFSLITTEVELKELAQAMKAEGLFSFDTETTGLDVYRDHLVGMSIGLKNGRAFYIPIGHSYLGCPDQIPLNLIKELFNPLFADSKIKKVAQNAKFDSHVLARVGITVNGLAGDSMLAAYLLNPEESHGLDHLAVKYLGHRMISFESVVSKGDNFSSVELAKACNYAAEDAWAAYELNVHLKDLLQKQGLETCYQDIEVPLVSVLFDMEEKGIEVDAHLLKKMGDDFSERLKVLESEIQQMAGCEFNISSPKQLGQILFETMGLPVQKKTKTGVSTDVDVLKALVPLHPIASKILEHRSLSKLKSTYIDQLRGMIHEDGRIRTSYHQSGTATGRLSSSDPNLQNIPIRSEEGLKIRSAFKAKKGSVILSADYSQIELRLLAELSADPQLVAAFKNDEDIHSLTASRLFESVTKETRAMAKTVNFGVLYGQSAFGLSQLLNVSQADAKKFIDEFYAQFPSVGAFKHDILEKARSTGEVRTWMGRRRLVAEINSKNGNLRANAERLAFNTVFQGSAADLIKKAMIQIQKALKEKKLKSAMLLQVHDELVFEVCDEELAEVKWLVKSLMETAHPSLVPLKVELGYGANWTEAH